MSGEGRALAAWLREDEDGPWQGVQSTCRGCERPSLRMEDGYCPACNGQEDEAGYHERRARAVQGLFRATAVMLRRDGWEGEAVRLEEGK